MLQSVQQMGLEPDAALLAAATKTGADVAKACPQNYPKSRRYRSESMTAVQELEVQ